MQPALYRPQLRTTPAIRGAESACYVVHGSLSDDDTDEFDATATGCIVEDNPSDDDIGGLDGFGAKAAGCVVAESLRHHDVGGATEVAGTVIEGAIGSSIVPPLLARAVAADCRTAAVDGGSTAALPVQGLHRRQSDRATHALVAAEAAATVEPSAPLMAAASEASASETAAAAASASAIASALEDEEELIDIPYAAELPADQMLQLVLHRRGSQPFGLVLDQDNFVVSVREGSPAAVSEVLAGDQILSVQGVDCSPQLRAGQLLRELPLSAACRLRVRRSFIPPLSLPAEAQIQEQLRAQRAAETQQRAAASGGGGGSSECLDESSCDDDDDGSGDGDGDDGLGPSTTPGTADMQDRGNSDGADAGVATDRLRHMWRSQARQPLKQRLAMASAIKTEGNDKFTAGDFIGARDEYTHALQLFEYEVANLARDQEAAELGDLGRGLGSQDWSQIQGLRLPCLLNVAAAELKLGEAGQGKQHYTAALDAVAKVLMAAPVAVVRAKAHFRAAQAHAALDNVREAWQSATLARELRPASEEVRELQLRLQRRLRQLQQAERTSARGGALSKAAQTNFLARDEAQEFRRRRALLRKLLPPRVAPADAEATAATTATAALAATAVNTAPAIPLADAAQSTGVDAAESTERRRKAETLLQKVAVSGWANLSAAERADFDELWARALPMLTATEVREGRDEGVFPPRDQERVFGHNLPLALKRGALGGGVEWLSDEQRSRVYGLAAQIFRRGVESLSDEQHRLAEAVDLLSPTDPRSRWHAHALGSGGAQLILSPARTAYWPFPPPMLRVQPAVLGADLQADEVREFNQRARRPLTRGEIGILLSNLRCWEHALAEGWEWSLVLEDDAVCLHGSWLQLLSVLPHIVHAAAALDPEWELLVLSPVDTADFVACISDPSHVPAFVGPSPASFLRAPLAMGDGWQRIGPTCHAFGWIYRSTLMRRLCDGLGGGEPRLNPLDIWVWEVMAEHRLLQHTLAPTKPLVAARPGAVSVKDLQTTR